MFLVSSDPISSDHHVLALDALTGEIRWCYQMDARVPFSPTVVDSIAYFATNIGGREGSHLFALDAATGSPIWRHRTGGNAYSAPVLRDGVVYVTLDNGKVLALSEPRDLSDGSR